MDTIAERTFSRNGLNWRVSIVPDDTYGQGPDDDCYSDEQRAAYRRGEWQFVGVVVTLLTGEGGEFADSLWSIEYGAVPEVDHEITIDTLMSDPWMEVNGTSRTLVECLQEDCRDRVRRARRVLAALPL